MMSDPRRRRSPESSRRRRKSRRDSRDREQGQFIVDEPTTTRRSIASNSRGETTVSSTTGGLASSYYPTQQSQFAPSAAAFPRDGSPIVMRSSEPTPRAASAVPIPTELNRPQRASRRRGSRSSLDSSSASSSSSSSYLDISRWYPSWGRGGGVLKTFFKTPSEHRPRRRRSQRKMHKSSKKTKGVFVFGSNNSSSSSVNSDMAYGMGFIKKPKSRGGGMSPNMAGAAAVSMSGRERSEGRPGIQRRQTDEDILEIGRKLQDVARMQNRADLDRRGKSSWESYQRQSSSGVEVSSRGLAPSSHGRRYRHASSSDDEWESASEGEDSDGLSALAYGHTPIPSPRPAQSSISRMSTASAIAAGSALVAGSAIAASRAPDRKSTVVDPKLFGPTNSLRDFVNTPCGFNDEGGSRPDAQDYAGSAESASVEARPLQRVFPLQTSDPSRMEAARASGSVVSSQQNYSTIVRDRVYSTTSVTNHPEPVPIQAPKPIAPVPSRIYDDERIRDVSPEPVEPRRKPTSDNSIYAETALVGAGVAALGAAILAGRDKGKGREDDPEQKHSKHERYGHDDHREDDTKVEDARKAQELRLMQEIERLEKALGKTNKAREQRRRDTKRNRDSGSLIDAPVEERRKSEVSVQEERDYERERDRRRRERQSKRGEPADTESRVLEDDNENRSIEDPSRSSATGPIDVFQFQVPDDAFATGSTPSKAPSPYIIDVTPSPSPAPERRRESRRGSLAEETRDAHHIYEEAHHSTAPIPEAVMAAAIGAVEHSRRHEYDDEEDRGRTNARTADTIQEEANKVYAARRVAEREFRSRSRSKSHNDDAPRIVTPPEMQNRPPKNPFSGANADFRFDMEMSPTQLLGYWPEVAPVRDPSAERPRPVLNLVMPTPAPTPEPERQRDAVVVKEPEPVEEPQKETPSVVLGPRGEVVEVAEIYEEPPTPSISKRVSWGPSEFKQYEEHSPERSYEDSPPSEKPKKGFGGWSAIAAAVTGAGVGAALPDDHEPKSPKRSERSRDDSSSGSRSPPKERPILSTDMSSRVLAEEPEELPPAPGPKPSSPRNSQQMPGAFNDDIDFAATLAAGLEHSGFDPEIVIDNPEYHRRGSPPGSNEPYTQPYAETVPDLGIYNVDDGYHSQPRDHGYVIGEAGTPGSEKAEQLQDFDGAFSKKGKRSSSIYDDIEVTEEPEEAETATSKLSKKERRKLEKAAQAAKIVEEEVQPTKCQAVEAGDDEWADPPTSKKSKRSKKAERSSVSSDDAGKSVNDTHVSLPVNAFDDIKNAKSLDDNDDWDTPKQSKKSKRNSKGYDLSGEDPPDEEKRHHRRTEFYEPVDRDVASVVSDTHYDDPSNGHSNGDDDRSVASAPSGSSKRDSKRSSGFWSLLGGKEQQQSKKDNADTLGAGVGLAGIAAVAMAAAVAGSDAAGASSGHKQEEPHVGRYVPREAEVFEDPEITPRVIKPAIDPQYGDLLPLPPSPGESSLGFDDEDTLPPLPDSRPTTPPGQAPASVRERESTLKRPTFASHARRPSNAETPLRSPSHTAIPIQFRMGHRSMPVTSPSMVSRSSPVVQSPTTPAQESPPIFKRNEFSPTFKRHPPRPTSWDNSREIKPLYLLERSARPAGDEEQHDEAAEMTPLPPSRESPTPEHQLEHEQAIGLGVDASPLVLDIDTVRSADYGSQEPTPTGFKPSEPLSGLVLEVETTPLALPSSSSLPESSYATPGEFPKEVETVSSPKVEPMSAEAPDIKEADKSEKQSYLPSALPIPPAAALAGFEVLIGQEKKDEAHAVGDDYNSRTTVHEPMPESAEPLTESPMELPSETSQINQTGLAEPEVESIAKSDPHHEASESPSSKAVDLQSPVDFQDAPTELRTTASPEVQPEATKVASETTIDTADWAEQTGSKKKKRKGKRKQSGSDAPQVSTTAEPSFLLSSNAEQGLPAQDANLEAVDERSIVFESNMVSTAPQQSGSDPTDTAGAETSVLKQSAPSQPDVVDMTADSQHENTRNLDFSQQEKRDEMDHSFAEGLQDSTTSQPKVSSEDMLTQTPGHDKPVSITPATGEPSSPQPETSGTLDEVLALPVDSEQVQITDMFTDANSQEVNSVENDWESPLPERSNETRKSVSFAEDIVGSPVPTSSGDKNRGDMQEPGLPQDSPTAMDLAEAPREQLEELLETPDQLLDPKAVHDDLLQQSQMESQALTEEAGVIASTDLPSDKDSRDISAGEVPTFPREQADEQVADVSQMLVEERAATASDQHEAQQEQEAAPAPVSAEEEYPIFSKKSKKNKKRKSGKVIDEPVQLSAAAAPKEDLEDIELTVNLPHQSASSTVEDVPPAITPSESKEVAAASEDVVPLDRAAARSPSPADETVKSAEATEDQSLSAQQDIHPTASPFESQETPASPTLTPDDSQPRTGISPVDMEALGPSKEPRLKPDASKSLEPEASLGETTQPSESVPEPIALPNQDDSPTKTSSDLEQRSFEPKNLQEPVHEVEVTSHEKNMPTTRPEQTNLKAQEEPAKTVNEEEATGREAEAAQIQVEEAEVARLQLKRKPSKKDKSRLKDLRARAQQRAEEAEAIAPPSSLAKDPEQPALEPEVIKASKMPDEPTEVETVEEPALPEQPGQTADISDLKEPDLLSETPRPASEDIGSAHLADEGAHADSPSEAQQLEDPEELAHREAEAEQIQAEENELARLKVKRKPSKKDKNRIKTLQANAEERGREAEASAQRRTEEQTAATQVTQVEAQSHTDLGQGIVAGPVEEITQPPSGSEALEDGRQLQVNPSAELATEDNIVSDVAGRAEPHIEMPVLGQAHDQIFQDANEPLVASNEPSPLSEQHVGERHESMIQEQLATSPQDIDAPPYPLGKSIETSEGPLYEIAKDVTEQPPSKPTGVFGGWGMIAAAVTGASIGASSGKDDRPEQAKESQALVGDHSAEATDDTKHLYSNATGIQDESPQPEFVKGIQSHAETRDAESPKTVLPTETTDSNPAHVEEPASNPDSNRLDKDTTSALPDFAPEQTAAIEVEPDSEWSLPSKKSKKDKKKKRKSTMSGDSGRNSSFATPLEADEPISVHEPPEVEFISTSTSQEEETPATDREVASAHPAETVHVEQRDAASVASPQDDLVEDVAPPALDEAVADTQEDPNQEVNDPGHFPAVDLAQPVTADEIRPGVPGSGQSVLPEDPVNLPASLVHSAEAASPTAEALLTDQGPPQGTDHDENETRPLIPSAGEPAPVSEATQNTAPQDQDTVPAVETSRGLPLETEPIVDEPQQLQADEFSWAPARKKDKKKKKKRGSVAWSEPASGSQTPIDEDATEHTTQDISQKTSNPTQALSQAEDPSEAREPQAQLDDWSPIMSSKKNDKETKASVSSWEAESSSQAQLDDEPREIHGVGEFAGSSDGAKTATRLTTFTHSIETPQHELGKVAEPDLAIGPDVESRSLANESNDQLISKLNTQPGALDDFPTDEPASKPVLERKIEEGEDTIIVAGGHVPEADLPLTGEVTASQAPPPTPPPTTTEDPLSSEAVPKPDTDSQIKRLDDSAIAADEEVADHKNPVVSERSVDLRPCNERISRPDLTNTFQEGEDTLIVAGGKVADEVFEPWAFEATHDSRTISKSEFGTKPEDGDETLIIAGGEPSHDLDRPSHFRDSSQEDSRWMTEPTNEFLNIDRPVSRPQSPAPWGDEDYSTSQLDMDVGFDQPVARSASLEYKEDEKPIPDGQDDGLDILRSAARPESPVPSDDNNSAFVTPFEDIPVLATEADPKLMPGFPRDEEQPFEWASTKGSKMTKSSISESLDFEPEPSTSVFATPQFEEANDQQFSAELVEAPGVNDPKPDEQVEPAVEDFDDWTPKKLSKKEKRKAKKGSDSAKSLEDPMLEPVPGSLHQKPTNSAIFGDIHQANLPQPVSDHLEKSTEVVEPIGDSDVNRVLDVGSFSIDHPHPSSPDRLAESIETVEPEEGETSFDPQTEPSVSMPKEAAAAAAAAVAAPLLTRKMSKKEKRRAKKASSSWEDDALESSQPQASAAENSQIQEAPIVASPIEDSYLTRGAALGVSPTKLQPDQEMSTNLETSTAAEVAADDEWAMPLSRKKSKGKKKNGKQLSLDSFSGTQTPSMDEPPPRTSVEVEDSSKLADDTVEELVAQSMDDFDVPTSPRPNPTGVSKASGGAYFEAKSPATLGTDLQKMPSTAPSPDPWESEDYFKPKTADSSPTDPPEEPFGNLEIHPAFSRGLNTTSETRSREERPLVGLGLIRRHSSIFQEDDGHTPKLLTLTSDNVSIESLAVEESQSAQVSPVASSSAHPQRRFPLSPRLSPRPALEDPPKSPIPDEIKLSQRGSVAMLAQRFGGKRKKVSKYVDKRAPVVDDPFDDPPIWEGAEHKVVGGSRMAEDTGDFWAVEDTIHDETLEPDVHPGQGSTPPAHTMGTKHGDDNVSATHSSPGPDAGRFTPELPGKATRQEEVPLEPMVESPTLGSQASNEVLSPEPQPATHPSRSPFNIGANQTTHQHTSIADTWDLIGARRQKDNPPTAESARPGSSKDVDLHDSILSSIETEHGESPENLTPTINFRRSVSRGLPPVQEEPLEEADPGKHTTSLTMTAPDINRDSGFATDSPNQAWIRRFDDTQQRDSGVHMRDYRDRSPGLRGSRGGSPDHNQVTRSSVEDEDAKLHENPRRSPLAKYERRLREETPVLEAQEPPVTPEPQKTRSDGSRAHKYPDLGPGATTAAALAGGAALLAAQESGPKPPSLSPAEGQRSVSDSFAGKLVATPQPETPASQKRAVSNTRMSRAKTPEPLNLRPDSPGLLRHSGTPPLRSRRTRSGDLRTLSQSSNRSHSDLGAGVGASPSPVSGRTPTPAAAANTPVPASSSSSSDLRSATKPAAAQASTAHPVANEGRLRSKDMADVYDGFGEGRLGSPRSPTRPHSMRRRQSMQVLDLENRVEQLMAENRALAEAKTQAELHSASRVTSSLAERDNEIEALKQSLEFMRKEIHRLTEVNEGLNSAISQSAVQHEDRYRLLETQHAAVTGELNNFHNQYGSHAQTIERKDAEIRSLREQLEATKEQVREMQRQILATNPADSDFLNIKDVDYFDHRCQQLCSHVQQWVLRFSKFSDMRACRLTSELNDEKIIDRLDNAVLDGSNVDSYLNDRVRRRDVFMSVAMTMIWDFVFTRYLFGMDREQRQKLKALEKLLLEVGPPKAVRQWRAVTLTLLSKRDAFRAQREQDTEAVVQAVFQTLCIILPPPSNLEDQIQDQLRKVMREAVDLSIEMRTQRAEYMMLPPLQPEYDASGDLAEPHPFNAQLMSERSGDKSNDDDLQAEGAIVRLVLFPLVVKKGDDDGVGDDEVVVCPAQVIVKNPRSSSRRSMRAPSSDAGGVSLLRGGSPSTAPNKSNVSMAEAEYIEGGI